jgi:hypothetical protein
MRTNLPALAIMLLLTPLAAADGPFRRWSQPDCPPVPCRPDLAVPPGFVPDSSVPFDPNRPAESNPFNEALASAGEGGTQPATSYAPGFFGDFVGGCTHTDVFFFGPNMGPNGAPGFCERIVCFPTPTLGSGFKPAENESPRPVDRIFYNYHFYGNLDVTTFLSPDAPPLQLHRHMIGFEKTLLGGDASIGLRLPFLVFGGNIGYDANTVADLVIIGKYALINNRETGNVLSCGFVTVPPSGGTLVFLDPTTNTRTLVQARRFSTLLQPWFGYVYNITPDFYVHGFHSTTASTSKDDVILQSNDLALGYWIYRNPAGKYLNAAIPTVEIHINTGLNHPPGVEPKDLHSVTLTCGVNFLSRFSIFGGAVGIPLLGQNTIEGIATYTLRW